MRARRGGGLHLLLGLVLGGAACASSAAGPSAPASPAPAPAAAAARDAMDEDGVVPIVSDCGFRVVVNDGDAHFALDLDGTLTVTDQKDDQNYFLIDDLVVQVVHVSHAQLGKAADGKQGLDLLRAHEAWESAYFAEQLHAKVEPREIGLESKGTASKLEGIIWWFPLPDRAGKDGAPVHAYQAYATLEAGDHVVGLSATARRGLEPMDLMARLARWAATIRVSAARVSPRAESGAVKAAAEKPETCPAPQAAVGIDRRLRLDEIPRGERDEVGRAAERAGGVERQAVGKGLRYRNHACRFELTYPDDQWSDFLVRDLSDTGCLANVATPLVYDPDAKKKITNAVVLTVARPASGFGPDEMQGAVVDTLKKHGAELKVAKKPLLDGGVGVTYSAEQEGTHYVGEIATVRRGDLLYSVHFTATRGTVAEGRKHLLRWLSGLRLDVP
jgi:hypothetical protein